MTTFIGIDLAWQSDKNHTGMAAFRGDAERVSCIALSSGVSTLAGVHAFLDAYAAGDTLVAIDAPLIVENATGRRACEASLSRRFARFHAGAHPSNRSLYPDPGGVALASSLLARGYRHCPDGAFGAGRWICEVYPHPAHVVLFERQRIIKYKKGRAAERRQGLAELRDELRARVFGPASPFRIDAPLEDLLSIAPTSLRGRALKHHEDTLDAVLCAYLAFHLWRWGWERSERIGDLRDGYIVVPTVSLSR